MARVRLCIKPRGGKMSLRQAEDAGSRGQVHSVAEQEALVSSRPEHKISESTTLGAGCGCEEPREAVGESPRPAA